MSCWAGAQLSTRSQRGASRTGDVLCSCPLPLCIIHWTGVRELCTLSSAEDLPSDDGRDLSHGACVASSCLHWQDSLQVPSALCQLTQRKGTSQVWVTSPYLIHSLICELSAVFFCNNSDIQRPAGFFLEKDEPSMVLKMKSFLICIKVLTEEARLWCCWKVSFLMFFSPLPWSLVKWLPFSYAGHCARNWLEGIGTFCSYTELVLIHKHLQASIFLRNHWFCAMALPCF